MFDILNKFMNNLTSSIPKGLRKRIVLDYYEDQKNYL